MACSKARCSASITLMPPLSYRTATIDFKENGTIAIVLQLIDVYLISIWHRINTRWASSNLRIVLNRIAQKIIKKTFKTSAGYATR